MLNSAKLVEKRVDAGVALDNLAGNCVLELCSRQFGGFEASLGGARTPEVKQSAWTDAPADREGIIFGRAEIICAAVFASAESAEKSLGADGWDERAVNGAVL